MFLPERLFQAVALQGLSMEEISFLYSVALEMFLRGDIEPEELHAIRATLYRASMEDRGVVPEPEYPEEEIVRQGNPEGNYTNDGMMQPYVGGKGEIADPYPAPEQRTNCTVCGKKLEAMFDRLGGVCSECARRKRL